MSEFPENEVEILRDYFSVDFEEVAKELERIIFTDGPIPTLSEAHSVNEARKKLRAFLDSPKVIFTQELLEAEAGEFPGIYESIKNRSFNLKDRIDAIPVETSLTKIDKDTISTAQWPGPIDFTFVFMANDELVTTIRHLPGYSGPKIDNTQIEQLLDLHELITGGWEREFRLGLLWAECLVGLAKSGAMEQDPEQRYKQAIEEYAKLLPEPPEAEAGEFLMPYKFIGPDQKFVAMRSAMAHLALGDFLFRKSFRCNESERDEILKFYQAASMLLWMVDISQDNPLRQQLDAYARLQRAKLKGGLNFLGYRDSYVPALELSTLAEWAGRRIQAATAASDKFERYRMAADELVEELAKLTQDLKEQELGTTIASLRVENAGSRKEAAYTQVDLLDVKLGDLKAELAAGVAKSVFMTYKLDTGESVGEINGPGLVGTGVGYLAQKHELEHQKRMAEMERLVALRDEKIALLEKAIADSRLAFVEECIDAKVHGTFNADRFYALANAYEDMTRRHVDAAFEQLYLLERVISFRRLKPLQLVEGKCTQLDPLLAPAKLGEILTDLGEEAAGDGAGQNSIPLPTFYLHLNYPIEFGQFRQSGEMEFVISLYDLEKLMFLAGHSNIRIKKLNVEVGGLAPTTGYMGNITHRGIMLFRDKEYVLSHDPDEMRFVPTDAQVQEAIQELESGKKDRAAVGGVLLVALDQHPLRFSSEGEVFLPPRWKGTTIWNPSKTMG